MVFKTKGIVFRLTKFGESSIIVSIFTEKFGLQSFIVNGIRSKSSKTRIALFQPLTLLDLVVYFRENANINRIKEVKCYHPYQTLHSDIIKSTIAMFITEVLNKCVKEESHAEDLCEFISSTLITLDTLTHDCENFHLIFLVKLSRFLGFGAYSALEILGPRVTSEQNENLLQNLLTCDYLHHVGMTTQQRRELLDLIIGFYNEHGGMLGEVKSLQVLREILS